ncbi:methyltransferase domain-containing protein [Nocardia sp. NPDC056952]|uniref:methyltransferase domain-containing protein n=1 Tax=Nocardia sp. NPDC056952 TaxID=3345979 RepID=UPI003635863B
MEIQSSERVFLNFYTTLRAGAPLLSDGGGPFGFDIQAALQFDFLVRQYGVSQILETGCCLGDTTDYLARTYPDIAIWTCDIDAAHVEFTSKRLSKYPNVRVEQGDSAELLPRSIAPECIPLVYLDAHWGDRWPLVDELNAVERGIVVVDDFDIGNPRFGFDVYDGVACDAALIRKSRVDIEVVYIGNPRAKYPYPCLQVGRRAGRCFIPVGISPENFEQSDMFEPMIIASY